MPSSKLRAVPLALSCLCALSLSLSSLRAHACGVSGPDGVWSCSLEEHEEQERPRWNLGAVGAYTWTKIRFKDDLKVKAQRSGALVSASYAPTRNLRFQLSAGVTPSGKLYMPDGIHEFRPGPLGALGVNYRFLQGKPFLVLSGLISASSAETALRGESARTRYTALDLRVGLAFGATFFESLSPYVVTRVFGGPIFWRYQGEKLMGTDAYHVQLGAGLSYRIARRVDVFVEGVPLGERAISAGAAAVF